MARYYEESALLEFVKKYTPTIGGETTMECVERAIRNSPAADVVPRAEVDHARLRGYENGIRSGARGVFKEIDELIKDYVNNHLDAAVLVVKLCLLKKKYTEGENKQKDFFSPEEVRAMSRKEVKENYKAIMYSMKKWHAEGE